MKQFILGFISCTALVCAIPSGASAQNQNSAQVAAAMQSCTSNEQCTLVTNSCSDNCGFIPVNVSSLPTLQATYQQRCGKPMSENPACTMNPPLSSACINNRCTIDYAYANHAGPKDYKSGAYPVPQKAVPSQAPASAAPADDRHGFTAYGLPAGSVREDTIGEIKTKVYVPPSAPVTGDSYTPVAGTNNARSTTPGVPSGAPVAAPPRASVAPYAPTEKGYATPVDVVPATTTEVPAPIPATPYPPQPAVNGVMPQPAPVPVPVPTATTTPRPTATPSNPIPSGASDAIPEPRTPQLAPMMVAPSPETGNPAAPVPPSNALEKPLAPPPGATVQVNPDDPGAPPQNMVLQPPVPRGPNGEADFSVTHTPPNP